MTNDDSTAKDPTPTPTFDDRAPAFDLDDVQALAELPYPAAPPVSRDVLELFRELHVAQKVVLVSPAGNGPRVPLLLTPSGIGVHSVKQLIDEYARTPDRRVGTARASTEASFVAHVTRFKSVDTVIFGRRDRTRPQLQAVYDYHPAGGNVRDAAFGHHRLEYDCPLSPEWQAWEQVDGKPMDVASFAAWLEDRITDVAYPAKDEQLDQFATLVGGTWATAADLIALSRGLQVNVDVQVRQAVTLHSGEIAMTFSEQHRDGQGAPLRVANLFLIQIPVFESGEVYRIPVRLRYTVREGKITWRCQRYRPDRVFIDAFDVMAQRVAKDTGCPLFFGAVES